MSHYTVKKSRSSLDRPSISVKSWFGSRQSSHLLSTFDKNMKTVRETDLDFADSENVVSELNQKPKVKAIIYLVLH